jgi:hypothetical protein
MIAAVRIYASNGARSRFISRIISGSAVTWDDPLLVNHKLISWLKGQACNKKAWQLPKQDQVR